ncbi:MAG: ATPase [Chitinophaga sp.]|jgi:Activator of Hsp90 ATPase homolog 1-like protein|nr:ATPase [Chitinophaga sp.]
MGNKDFAITITVNSSATEAFSKINQVNKWWAKKVSGSTEKLNDKFTVDFGKTYVDFQITELIPDKKIVWKVLDCNLEWINTKKEWNDTEVVFNISANNNTTQIDFIHIGLIPSFECYEDCKNGWTEHITESLTNFINNGEGKPE